PVFVTRFSPDGSVVAIGDGRGVVRLMRTRDWRVHGTGRQKGSVSDAVFAPDGKSLATAGREGASVWSLAGRLRRLFRSPGGATGAALSPAGSPVAAASPDGRWIDTAGPFNAGLWQRDAGEPYFFLRGDTGPLTSVSFSPDGKLVLSSSEDGSVRLYRCEVCGNLKALERLATRRLARNE